MAEPDVALVLGKYFPLAPGLRGIHVYVREKWLKYEIYAVHA